MKSASQGSNISLLSKITYSYKLLMMRLKGDAKTMIPWNDLKEYENNLSKYMPFDKQQLIGNRVLEIGFGARPWRLFSIASLGVDIRGIDLDQPTYGMNFLRLLKTLKANGTERFIKSMIRGFFDLLDIRTLKQEFKALDKTLIIDESRMVMGDAAESHHFAEDSFTFAFSEDVLEHIPSTVLPQVLDNVKTWLQEGSIMLMRPQVYTGICGGHDPDFYQHKVKNNEAPFEKAWSHLLNPNYKVNTFLNKLRLKDYIRLFSERFEILDIQHKDPNIGKNYLTSSLREKLLINYTEEELFSNQVTFILRVHK